MAESNAALPWMARPTLAHDVKHPGAHWKDCADEFKSRMFRDECMQATTSHSNMILLCRTRRFVHDESSRIPSLFR